MTHMFQLLGSGNGYSRAMCHDWELKWLLKNHSTFKWIHRSSSWRSSAAEHIVTWWSETGNSLSFDNSKTIVNMLSQKIKRCHRFKKPSWNSIWNTPSHTITLQVCICFFVLKLRAKQLLATRSKDGTKYSDISWKAIVAVELSVHPDCWWNQIFFRVLTQYLSKSLRKRKKNNPVCPSSSFKREQHIRLCHSFLIIRFVSGKMYLLSFTDES